MNERAIAVMMRCGMRALLVALLLLSSLSLPPPARADEVTTVRGMITWLGDDSVEVGGRRALLTTGTSITSNGRAVSLASLQEGVPAELEIDPAGRALDLRVEGAVE